MELRYITCSDPREHNPINEILELGAMPHAEIAVQCHPSKMSAGMPRNVWFKELLHAVYDMPEFNLAIHINNEWARDICCYGKVPDILSEWLYARNSQRKPIIKRVQLNMSKDVSENMNVQELSNIIQLYFPLHEYIFQYNDNTKSAIKKLNENHIRFSLLFDASGGEGKQPDRWEKPIYDIHPMGYAGGISPDNVVNTLRQINAVVPQKRRVWIDAEGRLKSNDLFNEKMRFDIDLARSYITRANAWANQR